MPRDRWIVNASPLIFLGKIDSLFLLKQLAGEVVVPFSVRNEVLATSSRNLSVIHGTLPNWISLREDVPLSSDVAGWDLGAGESQVLAQALLLKSEAVLDDLQGRRCARALGVPVTGTLGVILRAKKSGLIPAARPLVEGLLTKGLYLTRALVKQALNEIGE